MLGRRHLRMLCLGAALATVPLACRPSSQTSALASNVAQVRISARDQILAADSGAPYSGTLVAHGAEIIPLGQLAFRGTPMEAAMEGLSPEGLILSLSVVDGVPSGPAELHADLHAPELDAAMLRTDPATLEVARALAPTMRVAEATFEHGKLEGVALLYGPGGDTALSLVPLAEGTFRGSVLDGPVREFFPGTSQVRREYTYREGLRSGPQRWFYADGTVEREGTFVDGVPDGVANEFYADGSKRQQSHFDRGAPVDTATAWFPNGQLKRQVVYGDDGQFSIKTWFSNGAVASSAGPGQTLVEYPADGTVETFYASGALRTRTQYAAGVQHGPYEVLYSSGKRWEAGRFEQGQRVGAHQKWWKNGRLALQATYRSGARQGDYKRWYASGVLWEQATYEDGKRTGHYQKWWKNGAIAHDYQYVAGKIDGAYRTYYDGGERWAEGEFAGGKPQGTHKRWFPDGRLGYIKHHENGRPTGAYKRWYADGTLRLDATYVNGRLDGEFKNWLEDGSVYEFATYQRGTKIRSTREEPGPATVGLSRLDSAPR